MSNIGIAVRDQVIRKGGTGSINRLNRTTWACPRPGYEFPTSYDVVFFAVLWVMMRGDCSLCWCSVSDDERWLFALLMFCEWWWEVTVRFVDVSRMVDHHCFSLLFIVTQIFTTLASVPYYVCMIVLYFWNSVAQYIFARILGIYFEIPIQMLMVNGAFSRTTLCDIALYFIMQ